MPQHRGRPKKASPELLQEAAFELFQVQGYRATSVEQIARTAGFSRATFFNFFASKSELYWLETDALIARLGQHLEHELELALERGSEAPRPLRAALLSHAETITSANIPWALQNIALLESAEDLIAGGAGRVLGLNRLLLSYLSRIEPAGDPGLARATAATTTALLVTALRDWIGLGVTRGPFRDALARVFAYEV